jgi:hypothetical protein
MLFLFQPTIPIYYVDTAGYASDIYVKENYAYVADNSNGLAIIDVSDPKNPGQPSYVDTYDTAIDVYVEGNYAFVANGISGLMIIDISDPTNSSLIGWYDTALYALSVFVMDNIAYIADYEGGMAVVNVSDPSQPTAISNKNLNGTVLGVTGYGNYLYVTGIFEIYPPCYGYYGIKIFDNSDPSNLIFLNQICIRGFALDAVISDGYIFTAVLGLVDQTARGLVAVNVSNPNDVGTLLYRNTPGLAVDLHIFENVVYIADSTEGLFIIDVSNKSKIGRPISFFIQGETLGVFVTEDYAYIANGLNGLTIVDVKGNSSNIINYYIIRSNFLIGLIVSAALSMLFEFLMVFHWRKNNQKYDFGEEDTGTEKIKKFITLTLCGAFLGAIFGAFVGLMVESGRILTSETRFDLGIKMIATMLNGVLIVIPLGIIIGAAFLGMVVLAGTCVTIGALSGLSIGWVIGENLGTKLGNVIGLASGLIIGMIIGALFAIIIEVIYLKKHDMKISLYNFGKLMKKVKKIENTSQEFLINGDLEQFYVIDFVNIKNLLNILYLKYYKIPIPENSKIEDIIKLFEEEWNLKIMQMNEFIRFKMTREEILGQGINLDKKEIEEYIKFSRIVIENLKDLISSYDDENKKK